MSTLDDWLSTQEAAELSGYHVNHIRRLIRSQEIDARKWGNSWMVCRSSLIEYLDKIDKQGEKRGPKPLES